MGQGVFVIKLNVVVMLGTLMGRLEEMNNKLTKFGDDDKSRLIKLTQA
jgi:hypothetical protein